MITEPDDYFTKGCGRCARFNTAACATRTWAAGLDQLRRLCLDAGLTEEVKWGHPCYTHDGRNIALIGAFRGDFRITFMNAALLKDPDAVLERPGPNSRQACLIRFADLAAVAAKARIVQAYLTEAIGYAQAGTKPPADVRSLDLPPEMTAALDADPELAEAFHALTPGRQRSYAINLASAKKPETRVARIARFRAGILAGKGALER